MNKKRNNLLGLFVLFTLVSSEPTWAAGAARRNQQRKAIMHKQIIQKQRLQKQMIQQQILLRQQALLKQKLRLNVQANLHVPKQLKLHGITPPLRKDEAKEIVDAAEIFELLKTSSEVWPLIMDSEAKEFIISHYIDTYRHQGTLIKKPSLHYAELIDAMSVENPSMLSHPFNDLLKILAIIEYDFDNGQDKDTLARKVLGIKGAKENKKRLGF